MFREEATGIWGKDYFPEGVISDWWFGYEGHQLIESAHISTYNYYVTAINYKMKGDGNKLRLSFY